MVRVNVESARPGCAGYVSAAREGPMLNPFDLLRDLR